MPPKPKGKGKGTTKKKGNKPAWMSDALWELSQNLPKLSEFYSGDIKDTKLKEGQAPPPNITRTQAGMFIWQLLFPNNKAGKQKRDESVKLGIVETSVKILASGKAPDMTPALGILAAMVADNPQQRGIMLDAKPAPLPNVLAALADESASLRGAACALLRIAAREADSRPRLWRAMRSDWDWGPLVACLDLTDMSQLGGRSACFDAAAAMEYLCTAPEQDIANGACNALMAANGSVHLIRVLRTRNAHPMAKAAAAAVLNQLLRRASPEVCEKVAVEQGALEPLAGVFAHPIIPLVYKAHAAACLLRYIMPDMLWRATAAAAKAAVAGPPPATAGTASDGTATEGASPPGTASGPGPGASTVAAEMQALVARGLESTGGRDSGGGGAPGFGPGGTMEVPDIDLLDDDTREQVVTRARRVATLEGLLRSLVALCAGPDGPLPDLEAVKEPAPEQEGKAKAKKKKGKKAKKAKLEPGMPEAQTYASAVLRLASLAEDQRAAVADAGAVRYLLPLLDAKVAAARWNARQTLINLSMAPDLLPKLQLYKVPDYVHQANVPISHFERPLQLTPPPPSQLQHQDSLGRKKEVGKSLKPPALKPKA